jgi:hypothetical protein
MIKINLVLKCFGQEQGFPTNSWSTSRLIKSVSIFRPFWSDTNMRTPVTDCGTSSGEK